MHNSNFILYKNASDWTYAASIASTWVWAPALFVASSKAFLTGATGFLWFLIPNVLTLVLFAVIATYASSGFSLTDVISKAGKPQVYLHGVMSIALLLGSTAVQLTGLYTLVAEWFSLSKATTSIAISCVALAMVYSGGLKSCIRTDLVKYIILLVCGLLLAGNAVSTGTFNGFSGYLEPTFMQETLAFGITTAIGLFTAPYVDQTFWQRVHSIERKRIVPIFCKAALLFALVPIMFGTVGFFSTGDAAWSIATATEGVWSCVLGIGVFAALLSTLDSNLCSISAFTWNKDKNDASNVNLSRLAMIGLLLVSNILFISTDYSITQWFLLYGTLRTCAFVPTVLIIFDRYDAKRLFIGTLIAAVVATIGYAVYAGTSTAFLFTLFGLFFPLVGYKPKYLLTIRGFECKGDLCAHL